MWGIRKNWISWCDKSFSSLFECFLYSNRKSSKVLHTFLMWIHLADSFLWINKNCDHPKKSRHSLRDIIAEHYSSNKKANDGGKVIKFITQDFSSRLHEESNWVEGETEKGTIKDNREKLARCLIILENYKIKWKIWIRWNMCNFLYILTGHRTPS